MMTQTMGTGELGIVEGEAGCDRQPRSKGTLESARWGNGKLPKDLMKDVYVPQMGIKADRRLFGDHSRG